MASFPVLKTGVVAQYPSDRERRFSTTVHQFLNGEEQRFPAFGSSLRRWMIRLDLLDEEELFRVEQFFLEQSGAAGQFEFTDPWDGTLYPDCSFERDAVEIVLEGPGQGTTALMVRENR